ncbi:radical SAM family heme chaperone HemW [Rubinisphaera margarita]|uniref:radical SAM family heme chaperone HemW n=1 Tax=Rubinisphaera margarita TaxID=2909586 RepID=UPI001EE80B7D|nr:radical SAM family heme chaperone HemW [Rubinisphaera margarita]MCG6154721.1 radical SAM family heme chaperone HemW [Rubinisphaera margarita]
MSLSPSRQPAESPIRNNWPEPRAAYIHVPFCRHRCGYCDFSIIAGRNDLVPRYLAALRREIETGPWLPTRPHRVETLYIGGGTPTLLSAAELRELLTILDERFERTPTTEYTIEANPDGLTVEKMRLLREFGVNRISLGVQTFFDDQLVQLERTHSAAETVEAIQAVRRHFENYSIDLIFALPGQTLEQWEQILTNAMQYEPPHISTYALTFEKGTRFWGDRDKGLLQQTDTGIEVEMYRFAAKFLQEHGYRHYEVSNFAKAGNESRHNATYWSGRPFVAFGPGAASFVNGRRQTNHRSAFTWMKRLETGESPIASTDELTPEERARELLAVGLRQRDGIPFRPIREMTGYDVFDLCRDELAQLAARNWIGFDAERVWITPEGLLFADEIAAELI